jgi:hypothetical protein
MNMIKNIRLENKHYRGLSELWIVDVSYIQGGPHSRFEGTMNECSAFIQRTMVKTGQPYTREANAAVKESA